MPSRKKKYLLELFMDDGYLALVLDDPISLDEWYTEINDEIGQAKNTLKPHVDKERPNHVYSEHHQVHVAKCVEVSDHYGFDEVESMNQKKSELERSVGTRWLCLEKDAVHILKPVGNSDVKVKGATSKNNKIAMMIKHDNILVFNRGKRGNSTTPWVTIIFGQKDPIYSWQKKNDNNIRKHWEDKNKMDKKIFEEETKRRQNRILYRTFESKSERITDLCKRGLRISIILFKHIEHKNSAHFGYFGQKT